MNSPGLKVVAPSTPADAKGLLKASIRDDDPVVFIEHTSLYYISGPVPDGDYVIPIGKADVKREGKDVTIITYSMLVYDALSAAEKLAKEGIDVEVIDLRTIKPIDEETILESIKKTGRVVVAYEGCKTAGVGAEISAMIAENALDYLRSPIIRVAGPDTPQAASAIMMDAVSVGEKELISGIRKAME